MRLLGYRRVDVICRHRARSLRNTVLPIVCALGVAALALLSAIAASQTVPVQTPTTPPTTPQTSTPTPQSPYPPGTGYPRVPATPPGVTPPGTEGLPTQPPNGELPPGEEEVGPEGPEEEQPEEGVEEEEIEEEEEEEVLPIFGHGWFADAAEEPVLPSAAPPPPTYVLGPGDTVQLMAWGRGIEYVNTVQMIATDGGIYADPVGRIPLAGKSIADSQSSLSASFRKYFPECSVSLTVAELRSIEVLVVGDVVRPGRVVLPGTATAFTALYAVGGPLESGSLRAIDIRRGANLIQPVDLYDFFLRGETGADIALQAGDTVFVHVIGDLVAVKGEVRRQARYEIDESATLADALDMAGGITGSAYASRVQLARSDQNTERVVLEADLLNEPERWRGVELQDGDEVIVLPVLEDLRNAVTVEGEVRRPGDYTWREGMRVSDVIRRAEDLTPAASREVGHVLRESPEGLREMIKVNLRAALEGDPQADIELRARDIVRAYAIADIEPTIVYAEGAVVNPAEYEYFRGMTVGDLVRAAGGLANEAYGEAAVLVRKSADIENQYLAVAVGKILAGIQEDVRLEPRDKLFVALREEKARPKVVEVGGAVVDPGEYPVGAGMRLADLINMAGGLLPEASGEATIIHGQTTGVSRTESVDVSAMRLGEPLEPNPILVEGDTVAIRGQGGFTTNAEVAEVLGQVARPDVFPIRYEDGRLMRLSELLERAGGLLPTAYPEMAAVYHSEESLLARERRVVTVKSALQESSSGEGEAPEEGQLEGEATEEQTPVFRAVDKGVKVPRGSSQRLVQVMSGAKGEAHIIIPPRPLSRIKISAAVPVDLTRVLDDPGGPADLELQDGDVLAIFQRPDTVIVDGAVASPGPQPFVDGATVDDYIWEAGGRIRDSDMKHAVIVSYNGRAVHARRGEQVQAGDWIIVPTKYITQSVGGPSAFEDVFSQITQGLSTFLIFRRL